MSDVIRSSRARSRPLPGARVWFIWMVGMWVAFFWLLFADRLDDLWRTVMQLPVLLEIVVWIVFLPWMLGTWVWTSSLPDLLRVGLVLCFVIGWTVGSIPRGRKQRS